MFGLGKRQRFEYISSQCAIDFSSNDANLNGNELAKVITFEMGKALFDLQKAKQEIRGGRWEVVSHSLLLLGSHLIVSFLLRRNQKKNIIHQDIS